MLAEAHLRRRQGKAVPCDVLLRDRVPTAVLDGDARFIRDGFETNFHSCHLLWSERGLAPGECEQLAWTPGRDVADLEGFAAGEVGDEPPAFAGLEPQYAITAPYRLRWA